VWRHGYLDRSAAIAPALAGQGFFARLGSSQGIRKHASSDTWKNAPQALPSSTTATHCYDRTCFRRGDLFGRRHRYNKAGQGRWSWTSRCPRRDKPSRRRFDVLLIDGSYVSATDEVGRYGDGDEPYAQVNGCLAKP